MSYRLGAVSFDCYYHFHDLTDVNFIRSSNLRLEVSLDYLVATCHCLSTEHCYFEVTANARCTAKSKMLAVMTGVAIGCHHSLYSPSNCQTKMYVPATDDAVAVAAFTWYSLCLKTVGSFSD